ncbi:ABC transporter ATP-binding protein [Curvibacter sp. CHRR-16]|uniref:energy-coupling factor ABC transporter ATP-binding protein n=1 Tax=Curvibacter sp. CHRR-16 TaxID=2835872 RepID=UPI001BDB4B0C|nr:ABC transporter ATP-binding protein [Curvibacter sp. CHRR-16]MBT0569607.1 ABC transporter ATP-binding protein [Curvibacter sp. CHRR-16]
MTIRFNHVAWVRGTRPVLSDIDLHLTESRIGLIGDNGAGKSSLFRLICGLDQPSQGTVHTHDQAAHQSPPGQVGLMFQNPDEQIIFPTVAEELAFTLTARGMPRQQAHQQALEYLSAHQLGDWATRAIHSLSQGQRQYVCWLAMRIGKPRILLLDEPYASLDLPSQAFLQRAIASAEQQILVSTHQLHWVRDFERVLWLDQGRVRADGPGTTVCAAYEADVAQRMSHQQGTVAPC